MGVSWGLCAEAGCRQTWRGNHTIVRLSQHTKHSHVNATTLSRLAWCAVILHTYFLFTNACTLKPC